LNEDRDPLQRRTGHRKRAWFAACDRRGAKTASGRTPLKPPCGPLHGQTVARCQPAILTTPRCTMKHYEW